MEELIMSLNHIKHFAYQEANHFLFAILKSDLLLWLLRLTDY